MACGDKTIDLRMAYGIWLAATESIMGKEFCGEDPGLQQLLLKA